MGWWIALGVIFLLGILPLGVSARYSGEGELLRVVIGPLRLTLFPRKKKEKMPSSPKEGMNFSGGTEETGMSGRRKKIDCTNGLIGTYVNL